MSIIEEVKFGGSVLRRTSSEEYIVDIDNNNGGYHDYGSEWWFKKSCPFSFKYLNLDSLYSPKYFNPDGVGHPMEQAAHALYGYMQDVYVAVTGHKFGSILEFGSGGGEITTQFMRAGLDFITVEGTDAGFQQLLSKKIPQERILKHNLKFFPKLARGFDLVMCTEVAEHIEPFFASKLVDNCIQHSEFVWFSAADNRRRPHFHHMNEQDIEVWDHLFSHMGYPWSIILNGMQGRAARLYIRASTGNDIRKKL